MRKFCWVWAMALCLMPLLYAQEAAVSPVREPGLLFYLSGDHGFRADFSAAGTGEPNYLSDVTVQPGGAKGSYLRCGNNQLLSYWAPGNIYSQRGTLSFYWRSRDPVDATEFPIFRVGYADHSSWDQVWLRIDYNGHGFDAFVTDNNLGRTRVSYTMPSFPKPNEWVYLTLAWDETQGIRFYVNGQLAGAKVATGPFDAALDQFGPHSRIIGPTGVESSYNFDRGGDLDELRIYDRMLSDENIAQLTKGEIPKDLPPVALPTAGVEKQHEWARRYGWNDPRHLPAPLPATATVVRKVEIHDAYDLKRWWWRATDGIPETTWPGVYNRSSLPNRYDYFQLPDWDCYSLSGKSITFNLPEEPWNHLEVRGGAWGRFDLLTPGAGKQGAVADPDQHDTSPLLAALLFDKARDLQRTSFDTAQPIMGEKVRFTNVEQEWPIGEFAAYYVHPGAEPKGVAVLRYRLSANGAAENVSLAPLNQFIHDRFEADERTTMLAEPDLGSSERRAASAGPRYIPPTTASSKPGMPIVHILVPADLRTPHGGENHGVAYDWENLHAGLDGIAIDLPALNLQATNGALIPMNIQVMDPIWPGRTMLDFSFSVKPGEAHTLWLDTRDRLLPNGKSLYLTIASASPEFGAATLEGARLRLIFKPWNDALPEHVADRLTQVRDNYSNMVEESVSSRRLNTFNRFDADITDLLRVDPENDLGRKYWNEMSHEQITPPFTVPQAPAGVPQWAFLQVEDLHQLKSLIEWYIDNRQLTDGEIGGGLGDDSDFFNWWPGLAFMGADPDKLKASLLRGMEAMYANGMFTNGLATGQYDELHSYEDGINTLGQSMMLDYGSPRMLERAMETSRALVKLTGVNSAGQRQIRSSYYSGTKVAENGVWGWAKDNSYFVFHPALQLVSFNGTPEMRKVVEDVADGFLAHRRADAWGRMQMHFTVNFHTNEDRPSPGLTPWFMLWASYKWTGDPKYLSPFEDSGPQAMRTVNADIVDILNKRDTWGKQLLAAPTQGGTDSHGTGNETGEHFAWQLTGDTHHLENVYAAQLETAHNREFINREGSLWIDRIYFNNGELQRARLGGVALMRNYLYPGNVVSWRFQAPAKEDSVAILVPVGTPDHIRIIAYNLEDTAVTAQMTGWEIDPGEWEIQQSTQATENGPLEGTATSTRTFERSRSLPVTFAPHTTTVLELKLKQKGVPYWSRPDLGIDPEDVHIQSGQAHSMRVTVHSLGAVDAPTAKLVLRDRSGRVLATAPTPAMKAPADMLPKKADVTLNWKGAQDLQGGSVSIEMTGAVPEITQMNNMVTLLPQLAAGTPPRPGVSANWRGTE